MSEWSDLVKRNGVAVALVVCPATKRWIMEKRSKDVMYSGTWGLPGGAVEDGEEPAEAARRELAEEVNVHGARYFKQVHLGDDPKTVCVVFTVEAETKLRKSKESTAVAWVDYFPGDLIPVMEENLQKYKDLVEDACKPRTSGAVDAALTPAFKSWFGRSLVVDEYNKPMRMYHGTVYDIKEFKREFLGKGHDQEGPGFYFTSDPASADGYASDDRTDVGLPKVGPNVMPVYLRVTKPVGNKPLTPAQIRMIIAAGDPESLWNFGDVGFDGKTKVLNEAVEAYRHYEHEVKRALFSLANDFYKGEEGKFLQVVTKATGYDGMIVHRPTATHVVVFSPEQIKSVYNKAPGKSAAVNASAAQDVSAEHVRTYKLGIAENRVVRFPVEYHKLKHDPNYKKAKAGDDRAAVVMLNSVADDETLTKIASFFGGCTFVAPHAVEASGRNAIPQVLANICARISNGKIDLEIVQVNKVGHTGAGREHRFMTRASFEGTVKRTRYVLVDDNITSAATLADLGSFIRSQGGTVVGIVSLTSSVNYTRLNPDPKLHTDLQKRFGKEKLDALLKEHGHTFGALTAPEVEFLSRFRNANEVRNRLAKATQTRDSGTRGRAFQAVPGPAQGQADHDESGSRGISQAAVEPAESLTPDEQWEYLYEVKTSARIGPYVCKFSNGRVHVRRQVTPALAITASVNIRIRGATSTKPGQMVIYCNALDRALTSGAGTRTSSLKDTNGPDTVIPDGLPKAGLVEVVLRKSAAVVEQFLKDNSISIHGDSIVDPEHKITPRTAGKRLDERVWLERPEPVRVDGAEVTFRSQYIQQYGEYVAQARVAIPGRHGSEIVVLFSRYPDFDVVEVHKRFESGRVEDAVSKLRLPTDSMTYTEIAKALVDTIKASDAQVQAAAEPTTGTPERTSDALVELSKLLKKKQVNTTVRGQSVRVNHGGFGRHHDHYVHLLVGANEVEFVLSTSANFGAYLLLAHSFNTVAKIDDAQGTSPEKLLRAAVQAAIEAVPGLTARDLQHAARKPSATAAAEPHHGPDIREEMMKFADGKEKAQHDFKARANGMDVKVTLTMNTTHRDHVFVAVVVTQEPGVEYTFEMRAVPSVTYEGLKLVFDREGPKVWCVKFHGPKNEFLVVQNYERLEATVPNSIRAVLVKSVEIASKVVAQFTKTTRIRKAHAATEPVSRDVVADLIEQIKSSSAQTIKVAGHEIVVTYFERAIQLKIDERYRFHLDVSKVAGKRQVSLARHGWTGNMISYVQKVPDNFQGTTKQLLHFLLKAALADIPQKAQAAAEPGDPRMSVKDGRQVLVKLLRLAATDKKFKYDYKGLEFTWLVTPGETFDRGEVISVTVMLMVGGNMRSAVHMTWDKDDSYVRVSGAYSRGLRMATATFKLNEALDLGCAETIVAAARFVDGAESKVHQSDATKRIYRVSKQGPVYVIKSAGDFVCTVRQPEATRAILTYGTDKWVAELGDAASQAQAAAEPGAGSMRTLETLGVALKSKPTKVVRIGDMFVRIGPKDVSLGGPLVHGQIAFKLDVSSRNLSTNTMHLLSEAYRRFVVMTDGRIYGTKDGQRDQLMGHVSSLPGQPGDALKTVIHTCLEMSKSETAKVRAELAQLNKAQASQTNPAPADLGKHLKAALATDEAYKLLDKHTEGADTWLAGGCALLAKALAGLGLGTLVVLEGSPELRGQRGPKQVQHWLVQAHGLYLDGDGVSTKDALVRRWHKLENMREIVLRKPTAEDFQHSTFKASEAGVVELQNFLKDRLQLS